MKKYFLLLFSFLIFGLNLQAQIPTECLEIESILVDACGGQEGLNEMVRFQVGPNDIDSDNLSVIWATTFAPWEGVIQNGTTANLTAELNATVESCGILIEPANGIIPAGAHVLLTTSYLLDPDFNSFAELSDTLYIIYHNDTDTGGHFGNYQNNGTKEFTLALLGPGGCSDNVEYERNQLIDINGVQTAGDGATVNYDWDNNATYVNNGCTAPIIPFGVTITEASPDVICPGDMIELEATTIDGSTNVIWSSDAGSFTLQNNLTTTYLAPTDQNSDFYIYSGIVGACSGSAMDSILITMNDVPDISVSPENASICGNQSVTLTASGGQNYTWSTDEIGTSIEVDEVGTYFVIDNSCGVDSAFVEITLSDVGPTATIEGETSFCFGETITLLAEGGTDYEWQDGTLTADLEINSAGTYTVVVSDECGADTTEIVVTQTPEIIPNIVGDLNFCEGETINLTASGGTDYEWTDGETSAVLEIDAAGTYDVEVIIGNCSESTSITVTQHFPSIDLGEDVEACSFNTLLTSPGFDEYLWQDGSTDVDFLVTEPGDYSVTVTDEYGCETEDEVSFEIGSLLLELGDNQFICTGQTTTILAPDLPNTVYEWQDGSAASSLTVDASGMYSVVISQDFCQAEDDIEVTVYHPSAYFELDTITGCSPVEVLLQDGSTSPSGVITSWDWDFGDGSNETAENPYHQYVLEGMYNISLTVTTNGGCTSSFTSPNTIEVFDSPTADFEFVQETTEDGLLVGFTDQSTQAETWDWDFGDMNTSPNQNPLHLYTNTGSFIVTLTVSIDNDCSNAMSKEIFYEPEHYIYIPSAFTPNMDGVNDYFIPVVSGGTIATYGLSIYNRLGEKIYFTDDPTQVWLGGNHKEAYYTQNDVYNYRLEILFEGEAEKTLRSGVVWVVR